MTSLAPDRRSPSPGPRRAGRPAPAVLVLVTLLVVLGWPRAPAAGGLFARDAGFGAPCCPEAPLESQPAPPAAAALPAPADGQQRAALNALLETYCVLLREDPCSLDAHLERMRTMITELRRSRMGTEDGRRATSRAPTGAPPFDTLGAAPREAPALDGAGSVRAATVSNPATGPPSPGGQGEAGGERVILWMATRGGLP
jgi:hypothetical protein